MDDTLFRIELPDEYLKLGDRILETTTVVLIMQLLITTTTGGSGVNWWHALMFAFIGFFAYYLVVKKLIQFVPLSNKSNGENNNLGELLLAPFEILHKLRGWLKERL